MKVAEFDIEVEHKSIKNVHLTVYPPDGRVRIAVPTSMSDDEVSMLLYSKLDWLRNKYKEVMMQERQTERKFVSGENHYLFGQRYLLKVHPVNTGGFVRLGRKYMEMGCRPDASLENKQQLMDDFYRGQLWTALNKMVDKWAERMEESPDTFTWTILLMQKQWGSCMTDKRKIMFNLLLARVPMRCIEYVVVHELCHLKEHLHNKEFTRLIDTYMADWPLRKKELDEFVALPYKE